VIETLFLDLRFSYPYAISVDRLPTRLGEFISENVYIGKLRSRHEIMDYSCIAFIDVSKGEETKQGNSFEVSLPAR